MPTNVKKGHTAKKTPRTSGSGKRGLSGVEDTIPQVVVTKEVASKGAELGVWLIKGFVVGTVLYILYNKYTNRFVKLKENANYPVSNVSLAQAKNRADAIIGAKSFWDQIEFGSQYQATAQQLSGLNYNGFIQVYNAFGNQPGHFLGGDLNLVEFIKDQFSAYEVSTLSTLLNGAFFRENNNEAVAFQNLFNQFPKRV